MTVANSSFRWIWFVAARNIFRRRKGSSSSSVALSVLGIATGVLALIVIIAVMNGFQMGFIESILEVSSYHVRAGPVPQDKMPEAAAAVSAIPGVKAAVPFMEFQGIVRGRTGGQQVALVRGLSPDAMETDRSMAGQFRFLSGSFDLSRERSAVLGTELAAQLGVRLGDEITLFSIPSIFSTASSQNSVGSGVFVVSGIFRTGAREYDMGWMFVAMEDAETFSDGDPVLGIKIANRFHDRRIMEIASAVLAGKPGFESVEFSTWRDYNRAFFGALRTEKLFMFILVGLIFIVVALNIYQSQRRMLLERREEIGLLRAIGGRDMSVRMIFIIDGAIVGFAGAVLGLVPGLMISLNISAFFKGVEAAVNAVINTFNNVALFFGGGNAIDEFAVFSPKVFYLAEIPARVIPSEVLLIFCFGFLSSLLAAVFASGRVSRVLPADVLRYE